MFYGFDQVFNILFAIIFFCVLGTMVYIFVKNISTWNKNNNSPRLTVAAKIVAKRTKVFHNQQSDGFSTTTSTSYYVTFERRPDGTCCHRKGIWSDGRGRCW